MQTGRRNHLTDKHQRCVAGCLLALLAATAAVLIRHGPIAQPAHYHDFADRRSWLFIPHAADVLSNLPFLFGGWYGLRSALRLPRGAASRNAWAMFFAAVILTTAGSAFYHWSPDNFGLAIDRLPIAWACAWLTLALLAERVAVVCARPAALLYGLLVASLSVWLWYGGEVVGTGDLRTYLYVQFLPVLLIPAVCALTRGGLLDSSDWFAAIGLYLAAKVFESHDGQVLQTLGVISGHTLKHLLAAAAAFWLAWRLRRAVDALSGRP